MYDIELNDICDILYDKTEIQAFQKELYLLVRILKETKII